MAGLRTPLRRGRHLRLGRSTTSGPTRFEAGRRRQGGVYGRLGGLVEAGAEGGVLCRQRRDLRLQRGDLVLERQDEGDQVGMGELGNRVGWHAPQSTPTGPACHGRPSR